MNNMDLTELLRNAESGDVDFLREGVRLLAQQLMDADIAQHTGAERGERTPERMAYRNGYRPREWDTRAGTIDLAVPGCAPAATCPGSWNPAAARRRR